MPHSHSLLRVPLRCAEEPQQGPPTNQQLSNQQLSTRQPAAAFPDAETRVEASHSMLASLVASTADAVIAVDLDGTITDWNAGATLLFGYLEREAIGQNIEILVPGDRRSEYQRIVQRLAGGETSSSLQTTCQTKAGQPKDISLTSSLINKQLDGRLVGELRIVRDIAGRKHLEQQLADVAEQERRRIGQDLHDGLGQQISAVAALAASLQQTLAAQSSPELERIDQLVRGIEDAQAQLRLLSRGLLPVDVDGQGLMNALYELTASCQEMFGVAFIFDCRRPVSVDENITATHLYRIAQESINNAAKHARAGQIIVSLWQRQDGDITLQVRDDGVGLPANPSTTAGRGLQIMRNRTSLIGGTLSVAAGEEGGTVVTCTFPGRPRHGQT